MILSPLFVPTKNARNRVWNKKKQTNKQSPLKHSVQVVPIVVFFFQKGYTAFFVKRVEIISEESPPQPV